MRYHILHVESDPFNFHDWDVDEDFVRQIVRAFFRGIHVVKINWTNYQVGKHLLIYENPDVQDGYMQIFAGSMAGIRNPKAHANLKIDELDCWEKTYSS